MRKFEPTYDVNATLPEGPYEVIDGQVMAKSMSALSQAISSRLMRHLSPFVDDHCLGQVISEGLFRLSAVAKNRRSPDLVFVSYHRWPQQKRPPLSDPWEVTPEIAIEVLSPTNTVVEMDRKLKEYFEAGVGEVWVVSPFVEQVMIYTSRRDVRILGREDCLTCERFLPGFSLPLEQLFPVYDPEPDEPGSES